MINYIFYLNSGVEGKIQMNDMVTKVMMIKKKSMLKEEVKISIYF